MKTKLQLFGVGLVAAFFAGCVVQTINPLFTEKEYISYPTLVGTWVQKEGDKEQGVWKFEPNGQRYKLTHTDEKGSKATFDVAAGRIGTNVLLDSFLDDLTPRVEMNDFAAVHFVPIHTFVKIRKTEAGLTLVAMDLEWLAKLLTENPKAIKHTLRSEGHGDDKWPLLIASTEDLQKFVAQHAGDDKVFKNEIKLVPKPAK